MRHFRVFRPFWPKRAILGHFRENGAFWAFFGFFAKFWRKIDNFPEKRAFFAQHSKISERGPTRLFQNVGGKNGRKRGCFFFDTSKTPKMALFDHFGQISLIKRGASNLGWRLYLAVRAIKCSSIFGQNFGTGVNDLNGSMKTRF